MRIKKSFLLVLVLIFCSATLAGAAPRYKVGSDSHVDAAAVDSGAFTKVLAGTSGAPAYTFVGDNDTGVYRIGADNIGIAVGAFLALTLDVDGNHILFATLDEATGNEIAFRLDYTVNKATSGNDTGLVINQTDTTSPGTSNLIDLRVAEVSVFTVDNTGTVTTGVAGAPTGSPYITQTPVAALTAEQALSLLATGIVKNTTTTGILSIAVEGTDYYGVGGTDVAVADGGTGSSTAAAARTALDVDQAGTDNSTDVTLAGVPDYITILGQVVTRLKLDLPDDINTFTEAQLETAVSDDNPLFDGDIGGSVQAFDAGLLSIAGLTTLADKMIYTTALDVYAVTDLTSFARTILDDTNAAGVKTTLSLENVENTALSTWAGSTNLTTLGTVITGVWNGTSIADANIDNNITIAAGTIGTSDITLKDGIPPTADGVIEYDTTLERIQVGDDGVATLDFYSGVHTTDTFVTNKDSHDHVGGDGATIPVAGTELIAGTNISLSTNTLNVDDAFLKNDGDVGTGVYDLGGATVELPNSATPTTSTTGQIALDITIIDHQPLWQYYDGAENMTLVAVDTAELPALDDEIIKYDAVTDKWRLEAETAVAPETNSLETAITGILTTEVFVGNGVDSGTFVALSGDVMIDNAGVATIQANAVVLTTDTVGNYADGDAEGGAALTGDAAVDFFGIGVTPVTDTVTCTDIEGTALSITAGVLNVTEVDPTVDSEAKIEAITGTFFGASKAVTAGFIHIADGVDFESIAMTGDIAITSGGVTAIQANVVDDTHIDWGEGAGQVSARDIPMAVIAGSTFSSLQDLQNIFHSTGYVSGGAITDATAANIDIAAGTGLIRATNSSTAEILYFDWPALSTQAITLNSIRYVGVEYNAGTPQVVIRTSENWNNQTDFQLGVVVNEGGVLHIGDIQHAVGDHATNMVQRSHETMGIQRDNVTGGVVIGETGTRNITRTAGNLWDRLSEFPISALDTSVTGGFDTYSSSGLEAVAATQWPNAQYDNAGTLTGLGANKWATLWFYVMLDDELVMVYGTFEHNSMASAQLESAPSVLPNRIQAFGKLASSVVFVNGGATADFTSQWMSTLAGSATSDHGNLSGLADDDHPQYLLTDGTRTLTGPWDMGSQATTNVNIDSGVITGITDLATADGGTGASSLTDLIALTTHTSGNYVTSITNGSGITGGDGGGEGSVLTLAATLGTDIHTSEIIDGTIYQNDINDLDTIATDPALAANAVWFGTTGLIAEGATANSIETLLTFEDPTSTDKTVTIPNATGTVLLEDNTATVTGKTINTASNTITILEADISDLTAHTTDTFVTNKDSHDHVGGDGAAINLTTAVTAILPSANGGTGNGFTKFTGPITSEKTFTLPNATATIAYNGGAFHDTFTDFIIGEHFLQSAIVETGTVATGVWEGTTIAVNQGGTGQTSYTNGQLLIGNTTGNTLAKATLTGTANQVTVTNGAGTITISIPSLLYLGTAAKMGRDADNLFDFSTDNQITIRTNATDHIIIDSAGVINMQDNVIQRAEFKDYSETVNTVAASGATETLDMTVANVHDIKLTAACTFTFSNPPATGLAGSFTLILRQDATGGFATTWPASVDWTDGVAPTLITDANSESIFTFITVDAGTIWLGMLAASDIK